MNAMNFKKVTNDGNDLVKVIDCAYQGWQASQADLVKVIDSAYEQWQKSKVVDGARQFKVYYLDQNRKTRTLFVKAYDADDALEVAAEQLPEGCEVHSAVDTNPLG